MSERWSEPLYNATLEWLHYSKVKAPTKTDIANYWVDKHSAAVGSIKGAALTDAAVLFLRMAAAAGVGKFIAAGLGRDTQLRVDPGALEAIVTGVAPTAPASGGAHTPPGPNAEVKRDQGGTSGGKAVDYSVNPAVNINVQIHIAADAKPATIEEIFKNMRKYVLNRSDGDAGAE